MMMIAVLSWEIGDGEVPSITVCRDLKEAREELLNDAWDPDHDGTEGCREQAQPGLFDGDKEREVTCDLCRIESWDPASDGDFYLFQEAGRGDMQVCATTVAVPK